MEMTQHPLKIRFYKEEWFDEEQLFMEASADSLLKEITCLVTMDQHPAEYTASSSGTPSNSHEMSIRTAFYDVMKEAVNEDHDEAQPYFTFHINTKGTTAETPAKQLEANHTIRVKNPLTGVKRKDWPEWDEPQFDLPEFLDKALQKDDFTISISPQYTGGDMRNFLDEISHFDLVVTSDKPLKNIDITAQLMDEWRKETSSVEVGPEARSHELRIEPSRNLRDQVKGLGNFSRATNENFDYFFTLHITDAEDKTHIRKVSAVLPNPYYEEINAEKQNAREVLAEVFQKKYGEDIAELKIESQPGWWAWKKDDASFQYGWEDDAIVLYRYFGTTDYDADPDEVWDAMQELTDFADGAGEFVYADNYYVLKHEFGPDWIETDDLEKKLEEFEKFADSEEVVQFLEAYGG